MKLHILAETDEAGVRRPVGLRVENLPKSGLQRIPAHILEQHSDYVSKTPEHIVFHTVDGDVAFRIIHPPGRYCLTCGLKLPNHAGNGTEAEAKAAQECRDHVATHGDEAETSEAWPQGYCSYPRTYQCQVEKQDG